MFAGGKTRFSHDEALIRVLISAAVTVPSKKEIDIYRALHVSLKLYNILESICVSTDVMQIRRRMASITEILFSISSLPNTRCYIFGSSFEGSSTLTMGSDVDYVYVNCKVPVVCKIESNSNLPYPVGSLLIPDHRFPGYAKLQLIHEGKVSFTNDPEDFRQPSTPPTHIVTDWDILADNQNRLCLINTYGSDALVSLKLYRQGPALTCKGDEKQGPYDSMDAFECDTWPPLATEWLTRRRKYDWPSSDLIQKIKSYGFIMVNTFHPLSDEKRLQWRLPFSRQERLLVLHFNSAQMKCYVLLKLIKININKEIGEETLTSYHCKTCMFYMLENTPNKMWIPENLASCLLMCLKQIRLWVMNDNCPNYFIPGENMFDRITNEDFKRKLFEILDNAINSDLERLILAIKTDKLDEIAFENEIPRTLTPPLTNLKHMIDAARTQHNKKGCVLIEVSSLTYYLVFRRNCILKELFSSNIEIFTKNIRKHLFKLERSNKIFDHFEEETTTAKSLIIPFLQLALLSNTVVKQLLCDENEEIRKTVGSKQWDELQLSGISKLKQASVSLALKNYNDSLHTLFKVSQRRRYSLCTCYKHKSIQPSLDELWNITGCASNISVEGLLKHIILPCVSFLPTEQLITPCAINYEMIRSFGVPMIDRDIVIYLWSDWGTVDGTFLTIFLLYLNFKALGQTSDARKSIKKMIWFLNKGSISHRETCLNLLGWVQMGRGNVKLALECFAKSLKAQPSCNAACWHLCFLICCL